MNFCVCGTRYVRVVSFELHQMDSTVTKTANCMSFDLLIVWDVWYMWKIVRWWWWWWLSVALRTHLCQHFIWPPVKWARTIANGTINFHFIYRWWIGDTWLSFTIEFLQIASNIIIVAWLYQNYLRCVGTQQ